MNFLGKIFTWWNGATLGTLFWSWRNGEQVGSDAQGNRYFRSKPKKGQRERRWVIYEGAASLPNGMAGCTARSTTCPKAICRRRASGKPIIPPTPPAL